MLLKMNSPSNRPEQFELCSYLERYGILQELELSVHTHTFNYQTYVFNFIVHLVHIFFEMFVLFLQEGNKISAGL